MCAMATVRLQNPVLVRGGSLCSEVLDAEEVLQLVLAEEILLSTGLMLVEKKCTDIVGEWFVSLYGYFMLSSLNFMTVGVKVDYAVHHSCKFKTTTKYCYLLTDACPVGWVRQIGLSIVSPEKLSSWKSSYYKSALSGDCRRDKDWIDVLCPIFHACRQSFLVTVEIFY